LCNAFGIASQEGDQKRLEQVKGRGLSKERLDSLVEQLKGSTIEVLDFLNSFLDKERAAAGEAHPGKAAEGKLKPTDEAHEWRQPLSNILGILDLLTKEGTRPEELLSDLANSYQHLEALLHPREGSFAMGQLIDEVRSLTAHIVPEVSVEFHCSDALRNAPLVGNLTYLKQILINLISNAKKYTDPKPGVVTVFFEELANKDDAISLKFRVVNYGKNMISAEQQALLFGRFTQLEEAQQAGTSGLGLGLSLKMVQTMGGEQILIDSCLEEPGRAVNQFHFDLTFKKGGGLLAPVEEEFVPPEPVPSPARRKRASPAAPDFRFVVAEDTGAGRRMFARAFERFEEGDEDYEVYIVPSGENAVRLYERYCKEVQVFILDMHMGDGKWTGLETARKIFEMAGNHQVFPKIIIYSGASIQEDLNALVGSSRIDDALRKVTVLKKGAMTFPNIIRATIKLATEQLKELEEGGEDRSDSDLMS
jgi:signal transduction histidine kinase